METTNKERTALIIGQTGMDAKLMYSLLKEKGYSVTAILGRSNKGEIFHMIDLLRPMEIYNLAGYSHTFLPCTDIDEVIKATLTLPAIILDAISQIDKSIKFFNASSCLIYGKNEGVQNENSPINPIYPYGVSKAAANQIVKMYREDHDIFACSGIFFPHEHPTRGDGFFTKKMCKAVARIAMGSTEKIDVARNPSFRDWSWSPDVMEAAYLMLQHHTPTDFVIGSGVPVSLTEFVWLALLHIGVTPANHMKEFESVGRNNDWNLRADITKIKSELGWEPKHDINFIICEMVNFEIEQLKIKI